MGCMKSKIRNEETVKDQKRTVKDRNKFAQAHSYHAMSLKKIGAALSDYVQDEFVYPAGVGGGEATIRLPLPRHGKRGAPAEGKTKRGLSLSQIFVDLNDCFLKSSESARDISRLLEETHLVLNKMLMVWEKKLCDDVKAGGQMKREYLKKVALLYKLKKHDSNTDIIERMKAGVSILNTGYTVDMRSMDSTASEIISLCNDQLYPKLVILVDAMATMWETMRLNHEKQSRIVQDLRHLDISQSRRKTSCDQYQRTWGLYSDVQMWHIYFTELMSQHKEYIKTLNNWVKLNLILRDKNSEEEFSSLRGTQNPPIQKLLHVWLDYLERIPDEPMKYAIRNFENVIDTVRQHQHEEWKLRFKCSRSSEEHEKRAREFDNWWNKHKKGKTNEYMALYEKHVKVATLKLKGDDEALQRKCIQVRQMSLMSLKSNLPVLFRALTDFSLACSDMYSNLRCLIVGEVKLVGILEDDDPNFAKTKKSRLDECFLLGEL